jgi:RNA polymerase sigma-70 factor (ECF subfamily)
MKKVEQDLLEPVLTARERLVASLARQLGDRELAQELFQGALARALEKPEAMPRERERVQVWFRRVLRNAAADEIRHRQAGRKALQTIADEASAAVEEELRDQVCACMGELLPTLKPEQAQIVREVDLGERSVAEVAKELGISSNAASVRLHRGRKALKERLQASCGACATHHCLDCTCGHRGA